MSDTMTEEAAIRSLKRLAKRWPKSLGLFSGSGELRVMRLGDDGGFIHRGEGMDSGCIVTTINGIMNDGGDW